MCDAKSVISLPLNNFQIKFECREFRESVLGSMPHHWVGLLFLVLHCFS